MKKKWIVSLAAMVLMAAGVVAKPKTKSESSAKPPKIPSYLGMTQDGRVVFGYRDGLPADLVIPDGVTAIAGGAFESCTSLASVTIPRGVTAIGDGAFYGCTSLASITIPDSVTEIGREAFKGCASLKEIQFGGTTAQWEAIQGNDGIKVSCVRCSDGYIGVKELPEYLKMDGTEVTGYDGKVPATLVIPDGVTAIGRGAFEDCMSIESVTIPTSVTKIGYYAFNGCTSLKEIQFKGTMAQWKAIQGISDVKTPYILCSDGHIGVKDVPAYLKMDGTKVTGYTGKVPANVVIPNGVTEIGDGAFGNCMSLESVTIPSSVKVIDGNYHYGAFNGCTYLERVTIAEGVTEIGGNAFKGCTSLKSVHIPNRVTEIGCSAFFGCAGLTDVAIPGSVKKISGDWNYGGVFEGCTSLTSVTIAEGVTGISGRMFKDCTSLASITIPDSVTYIGGGAFFGCTALKNIAIPASVEGIYAAEIRTYDGKLYLGAFEGCTSLARVTIPSSVTRIDAHTFKGCTSLRSVTIPRGVTEIGDYAFSDCKSLASASIPRSVMKIGYAAFEECPNLKVQYDGTKAQWGAISKAENYYFPTIGSFTVQCTDGVVTER